MCTRPSQALSKENWIGRIRRVRAGPPAKTQALSRKRSCTICNVRRLFTKSKKHFVTFQYTDASGQGKFEIVRLDKANFTRALATLEADTGIKVERSEER